MASLPNTETVILDIRKVSDYCLDPAHRRGRNKARLFRAALGITKDDAEWLRSAILDAIAREEALQEERDQFGARWRVDVRLARQGKEAVVRTTWIIRTGEAVPRFVSCWVR